MTTPKKSIKNKKALLCFLALIIIVSVLAVTMLYFIKQRNDGLQHVHSTSIVNLKTNHLTNPLGLDEPNPTFSWQMTSSTRGAMQSAYRITLAEDEGNGLIL